MRYFPKLARHWLPCFFLIGLFTTPALAQTIEIVETGGSTAYQWDATELALNTPRPCLSGLVVWLSFTLAVKIGRAAPLQHWGRDTG